MSFLTVKEDVLPPHLSFSFLSFSCLKTSSNCRFHTPKQQIEKTRQAYSQTSSKPYLLLSTSLHMAILQHSVKDKTNGKSI
jgi:hypothetical protein